MDQFDQIKTYVASNQIELAIDCLLKLSEDTTLHHDFVMQCRRYKETKQLWTGSP